MPGAREPTFTVSTVPPQTLVGRTDLMSTEERGIAHSVAATVISSTPTPSAPATTTVSVMSSSSSAQGISE
jgi:hypothetical protein